MADKGPKADAVVVRELKDLCGECRIDYELVSSDTAQLEQESFELLMGVALDPKMHTKPLQCGPTIAEIRQKSPGAKKVYWVVPSYFRVPAKYAAQIVRLSFLGQLVAVAERSQHPVSYVIVRVEGPVVVNKNIGIGKGVKFSCEIGALRPGGDDFSGGGREVSGYLFPYARDSPIVTELRDDEMF
ncbi:MAG: hypothetical protein D6790_18195 [Caldilineae bacterium]|nr:MAG: hypothetical protein D6790_18195 [Caldilineae bacterium]